MQKELWPVIQCHSDAMASAKSGRDIGLLQVRDSLPRLNVRY
jgi:hypothetical protein